MHKNTAVRRYDGIVEPAKGQNVALKHETCERKSLDAGLVGNEGLNGVFQAWREGQLRLTALKLQKASANHIQISSSSPWYCP